MGKGHHHRPLYQTRQNPFSWKAIWGKIVCGTANKPGIQKKLTGTVKREHRLSQLQSLEHHLFYALTVCFRVEWCLCEDHLGSSEIVWDHLGLGALEIIWTHLDSSGIIWALIYHLGSIGIICCAHPG